MTATLLFAKPPRHPLAQDRQNAKNILLLVATALQSLMRPLTKACGSILRARLSDSQKPLCLLVGDLSELLGRGSLRYMKLHFPEVQAKLLDSSFTCTDRRQVTRDSQRVFACFALSSTSPEPREISIPARREGGGVRMRSSA